MPNKIFKVIGLMSGTSLDGLDIAYCHFWKEADKWQFEMRKTKTVVYPKELFKLLQNAVNLSDAAHETLHESYGNWLGEEAKQFIVEKNIAIDFIASHGHTSHHQPHLGITFQLGHGQKIANASGCKVICDFRTQDVKLGGQGAPLVPIGDKLLFHEYDFCLNLGGISNISFDKDGKRLAYDVGMANMPLNYLAQKAGLAFDKNAELAKKGKLNQPLFDALNELAYYKKSYPKSTGYEWFVAKVVPLLDACKSIEDALYTVIHHNCKVLTDAIKKENPITGSRMLVTGGGVLNPLFINTLEAQLKGIVEVVIPPQKFIEFKEALVFAFMGVLKELNQINVLKSVTGAAKDSCSGTVFAPKK